METPTFTSSVHYQDPKAALAWLELAFGFEVTMAIEGPPEAPEMCHYEMSVGGRGIGLILPNRRTPPDLRPHRSRRPIT